MKITHTRALVGLIVFAVFCTPVLARAPDPYGPLDINQLRSRDFEVKKYGAVGGVWVNRPYSAAFNSPDECRTSLERAKKENYYNREYHYSRLEASYSSSNCRVNIKRSGKIEPLVLDWTANVPSNSDYWWRGLWGWQTTEDGPLGWYRLSPTSTCTSAAAAAKETPVRMRGSNNPTMYIGVIGDQVVPGQYGFLEEASKRWFQLSLDHGDNFNRSASMRTGFDWDRIYSDDIGKYICYSQARVQEKIAKDTFLPLTTVTPEDEAYSFQRSPWFSYKINGSDIDPVSLGRNAKPEGNILHSGEPLRLLPPRLDLFNWKDDRSWYVQVKAYVCNSRTQATRRAFRPNCRLSGEVATSSRHVMDPDGPLTQSFYGINDVPTIVSEIGPWSRKVPLDIRRGEWVIFEQVVYSYKDVHQDRNRHDDKTYGPYFSPAYRAN